MMQFISMLLHLDQTLIQLTAQYGEFIYIVLFAIIFCETGLILMPFLPGDSLLFAAGSFAAHTESPLEIQTLFILLLLASILGNKVNFLVGRLFGKKILATQNNWLVNKRHLDQAHDFYKKHGGKTIIFARFLPIIRTYVPFLAGISNMNLRYFSIYNVISGLLWIGSLLFAGYFFGSLPFIQNHFTLVLYSIIAITLLPPCIMMINSKFRYFVGKNQDL